MWRKLRSVMGPGGMGLRTSRRILFLALRIVRRLVRNGVSGSAIPSVAVLLGRDAGPESLGDALNRAAWYFGGSDDRPGRATVSVFVPEELLGSPVDAPSAQEPYLDRLPTVETVSQELFEPEAFDVVLLTSGRDLLRPFVWSHMARVRVADPSFFSTVEANEHLAVSSEVEGSPLAIDRRSQQNFRTLVERTAGTDRSMVLGTGPSVNQVYEYSVDNAATIVCNSIVKNDDLLAYLRPVAICFADPVFHFGPSRYAAQFREDLVRAVATYDCFAVTCRRAASLLLRHYPQLADRLIAVRCDADRWAVPDPGRLNVRVTDNILTLMMVPIAASLNRTVWIGGCDGRRPDEDYFWEHDSSVQYEGLMRTAFESHPSFFRDRVYADYYAEHCERLEAQLSSLEERGYRIANITDSYIPALVRRSRKPSPGSFM